MDVPEIVQSTLDGEQVAASVSLKGEDALYVAPTRTIVYRGDGLLSDESVEEYPHDAERIEVREGRRKATLRLDYGLEGEREFTVPASRIDEVLHPVLAGVLSTRGVTDAGETVLRTYRFSEFTLVVTSDRVVKHVGAAVWDAEFEAIPYADVTGIDVEEGNVATQIVLEVDGRTQRIKTPNDRARDVREHVEEALFSYYGVDGKEAFERTVAADEASEAPSDEAGGDDGGAGDGETGDATVSFEGSGLAPIETAPAASGTGESPPAAPSASEDAGTAESTGGDFEESGFETAVAAERDRDLEAQVRALRETVERQEQLLAEQRTVLEELADAVSRGR